jgi:hypothetical protein
MHHACGVRGVQRRGDLTDDRDGSGRRQRAESAQHAAQVGALDKAHVHEQLFIDLTEVVDRHDVRFLQTAGRSGFPLHPLAEHRILRERGRHQLQRDLALAGRVLGLIHLAHAAAAEQANQTIRPELRARARDVFGAAAHCRRRRRVTITYPTMAKSCSVRPRQCKSSQINGYPWAHWRDALCDDDRLVRSASSCSS